MKIPQSVGYALLAIIHLAGTEHRVPISCNKLARNGKLPQRYLLQVLRRLVNCEILRSVRGVEGGYYLARAPDQITVLEVIETFENLSESSLSCFRGFDFAMRDTILDALHEASQAARTRLREVTIADLLEVTKAQLSESICDEPAEIGQSDRGADES